MGTDCGVCSVPDTTLDLFGREKAFEFFDFLEPLEIGDTHVNSVTDTQKEKSGDRKTEKRFGEVGGGKHDKKETGKVKGAGFDGIDDFILAELINCEANVVFIHTFGRTGWKSNQKRLPQGLL